MKLSTYVAHFLRNLGIRHVFAVSGGASIHLIHSLSDTPGINYICTHHEQAGAMAADAYSRITRNLGAAVATSGPGATNMITGVAGAYYDSVPVIYITGQVSTFRMKRDTGVRQLGFQETETVEAFKPFTKYSVLVDDAQMIRYELEKAVHIATIGRPGPVLVDIPDNIQREEVDPHELQGFVPNPSQVHGTELSATLDKCLKLLSQAQRPVLIVGWGVRLAKADDLITDIVRKLGIPVLPTWGAKDMFPSDDPLTVGVFGTHGTRYGNFAVQNADLVIAIGARIDTREAGSPITTFARSAKKIIVDIDSSELEKFETLGLKVDIAVNVDAKPFLEMLDSQIDQEPFCDVQDWLDRIAQWKLAYPVCLPEYYEENEVNPYVFMKSLSAVVPAGSVVVVDTGCAIAWAMQSFDVKARQRILHDFNNTAMGYALPASIAAALATKGQNVICISGDGSLQMNVQELATIAKHALPVKIFLLNNHGHSMIRQTQDQWLDSNYFGSSIEGGLGFPDFVKLAEAYGIPAIEIHKNSAIDLTLSRVLEHAGPMLCNVEVRPEHSVTPQVKFGRPIEDSEPLLKRSEFYSNMITKPIS